MSGPTGNVHDTGDFDFRAFFMDIPPVTRTLFLTIFSFTLLSGLGLLPLHLFILEYPFIYRKLQLWRLVFTFFHLGRLGLAFLIRMYFLFTYSKQLEIGVFFGRPANYAWFLTIVSLTVLSLSLLIPSYINGGALLIAIIHLWGRHATNVTVTMYGFIQIPAKYLSLTMLALDVVISGNVSMADLYGLLGGHLYYFLDSVYPTMRDAGGRQIVFVPLWFERFIDQLQAFLGSVTGLHSNPSPSSSQQQQTGGGRNNNSNRGFANIRSTTTANAAGSQNRAGGTASGWGSFSSASLRGSGHNWGTGRTLGSS